MQGTGSWRKRRKGSAWRWRTAAKASEDEGREEAIVRLRKGKRLLAQFPNSSRERPDGVRHRSSNLACESVTLGLQVHC